MEKQEQEKKDHKDNLKLKTDKISLRKYEHCNDPNDYNLKQHTITHNNIQQHTPSTTAATTATAAATTAANDATNSIVRCSD